MAALNSKVKKSRYPSCGIRNQDVTGYESNPERDATVG
ncbi:Uncharacterised protein [Citrobacter freundii]|nr:Uncharacterised protein [Citrobacter freundii]